ncbi:MAG: flavin monoamine oxidase family protein [Bdellovibrio sp.]
MGKSKLLLKIKDLMRTSRMLEAHPQLRIDEIENRRQFLKNLTKAGLATTLPLTTLLNACTSNSLLRKSASTLSNEDDPVIILGGGIAGLSAAFHLTRAGVACKIYEASGRIGGRMFSLLHFNSEDSICELGGEYVDTNHEDLIYLCRFFNIPLDSVDASDSKLVKNIYYFKNASGKPAPYRLDKDAIQMMRIFDWQYKKDFAWAATPQGSRHFDSLTLAQYLDRYRHRVDAWFLEMLRIAYVGECGLEANEQTALLLVQTLDPDTSKGFKLYGDSDQALRIRGGNQALISALENWLSQQGVLIHKNSPLESIAEKGNKVQLKLGGDYNKNISASRVICTIPFSVLKNIEGINQLAMSDLKKACVQEMVYGTNAKLMQGYSERFWRKGSINGSIKVPESNGMVYTHLFPQNLWETHHDIPGAQNPKSGILTSFLGGLDGANLQLSADAEKNLAATEQIFPGISSFADASQRAAMNWTRYPFNLGSYGSAKPNQISRFGSIGGKVELDGKLIFAGEHVTPKFNGYMNGACYSGKLAAETIIHETAKRSAA